MRNHFFQRFSWIWACCLLVLTGDRTIGTKLGGLVLAKKLALGDFSDDFLFFDFLGVDCLGTSEDSDRFLLWGLLRSGVTKLKSGMAVAAGDVNRMCSNTS